MQVIIAVLTVSILGFLFGIGLAYALKVFSVKTDPRIDIILTHLPGANCAACGFAGCLGFAEALAKGDANVIGCKPAGHDEQTQIAKILGVEVKQQEKTMARVLCGGGKKAIDKYEYKGVADCIAANLLAGGQKACEYACLGFATCVRACPFGAISMDDNDIPVVDPDICTSCGICVDVCPKKLFEIQRSLDSVYVKCNSKDSPKVTAKNCEVGCIACKICEKVSGGVFLIEENLSRPRYEKVKPDTPWDECIKKCPTNCIVSV